MEWLKISLIWYVNLLIIGIIFLPLAFKIFAKLFWDKGYAFSKIIGIIILSYLSYLVGYFKLLPFDKKTLFLILTICALANLKIYQNIKKSIKTRRRDLYIFLMEELLFLSSFIFWTFVRGQEPSIRGLEKFMDFGFINSILRTKFFPPLDMWLSSDTLNPNGYFINYYYFGHLTAAVLIKLFNFPSAIGYNLILSTLFALGITQTFSISSNLVFFVSKKLKTKLDYKTLIAFGLFSSILLNLGGNLHTIYALTKGYQPENPLPFWDDSVRYTAKELLNLLKSYSFNPLATLSVIVKKSNYWYPNATRFIPLTIHEFPSYSYVVADLHGHVLDIPYVLLFITLMFAFFAHIKSLKRNLLTYFFIFGFLIAIMYMTNAFDGAIYFLFLFTLTAAAPLTIKQKLWAMSTALTSFFLISFPFSSHFKPFASGIGVNCSPNFLIKVGRFGPFLFEQNNCQKSPLWMLSILWGYFWIGGIMYYLSYKKLNKNTRKGEIFRLITIGFLYSIFLIIVPEFFYAKDIYPAHFRANTMFKLGYQSFIISSILYAPALFLWKHQQKKAFVRKIIKSIFLTASCFVFSYSFFSIPSYYGKLNQQPQLDGSLWLYNLYPEDKEIIEFLNSKIKGQPNILEAQGDSYTDYERISAYTGLPTVAGWFVHEWLWRGTPDLVSQRQPHIAYIYEGEDENLTLELLKRYKVRFVIISSLERQKYPNLIEEKFSKIGTLVFQTQNKKGKIYEITYEK